MMRKAVISGICTILIIFLVFIAYAQERAPVFPIQVFGSITPAIPDNHVVYFKISNLEYASSNIVNSKYGYEPLLFLPSDDVGTLDKEGYSAADIVEVYIDSIKVKEVTNLVSPQQIDIELSTQQYNTILGITPQPQPVQSATRGGGSGGCFYKWNCTDWSACLPNGTQTAFCINTGTCYPKNKTMQQPCTYTAPAVEAPAVPTAPEYKPEEQIAPPAPPAEVEEKGLTMLSYIIIVLITAAAIGGLGFVIYEIKRSHKALKSEMKQKRISEDSFANLRNYVKQMLDEGYSKEQIRAALLQEGWKQEIINDVVK